MLAGEERAGAPEAGRDLVGDQEHLEAIAEPPDLREILRAVETHAPGALHDRLEDDRGKLVVMALDQGRKLGDLLGPAGLAESARRRRCKDLLGQHPAEQMVHPGHGIADRHGPLGVAVIAGADRHQPVSLGSSGGLLVLDGHLDGDLDRHRSRVAEKDVLQRLRRQLHQGVDQAHGRLVGQPAEHDVRHVIELIARRLIQDRMVVAVDGAPPGGHAVDQLAAVHEPDPATRRRAYRIDRIAIDRGGVGMPGVGPVDPEQLVLVHPRSRPQRYASFYVVSGSRVFSTFVVTRFRI